MSVLGWVVIPLLALPLLGQANDPSPVRADLCDLQKDPSKFNGRLVKIRAQLIRGEESTLLVDGRCSARVLLSMPEAATGIAGVAGPRPYAYMGPRRIAPSPGRLRWNHGPSHTNVVENDSFTDMQAYLDLAHPRHPDPACPGCSRHHISATIIGRFESNGQVAVKGTEGTIDVLEVQGFGRGARWPAHVILHSVTDVVAKPVDPKQQ